MALSDFEVYRRALRKRERQRVARGKMSSNVTDELQIHAEDDSSLLASPTTSASSSASLETTSTSSASTSKSTGEIGGKRTSSHSSVKSCQSIQSAIMTPVVSSASSLTTTTMISTTVTSAPVSGFGIQPAPWQAPGAWSMAPGNWSAPLQAPGQWQQAPGQWQQAPGTWMAPPLGPGSSLSSSTPHAGMQQWFPQMFGGFPFVMPSTQPVLQPPDVSQAPQTPIQTDQSSENVLPVSAPQSTPSRKRSRSGEKDNRSETSKRSRRGSPSRSTSGQDTSLDVEGDEEQALGLDDVLAWMADNLGELCPSPGPDVDDSKTIQWEPYIQIPPHPVATDLVDSLNEDFKALSLNSSFKAPGQHKSRYAVHSLNFLDSAAKMDEEMKYLTGSSSTSSYKVQDAKVAGVESEIKRSLKLLSVIASSSEAIAHNLGSEEFRNIAQVETALVWQGRALTDLANHLRAAWANSVTIRRLGFLSLSSWDEVFKKHLLRQPVAGPWLFNGAIPEEQKKLADIAHSEVALRALKSFSGRKPSTSRGGSYNMRRFRRGNVSGARGASNSAKSRFSSSRGASAKSSPCRGGRRY